MGPSAEPVPAHVPIVAARSWWLRDRIRLAKSHREKEEEKDEEKTLLPVTLPDADTKAFRLVLDFIYTDQIDPTRNNRVLAASNEVVLTMMQVYTLAVTFKMRPLEHLCLRYIENSINLRNVLVALKNASRLQLLFIKEFCQKFITKEQNYNQVWFFVVNLFPSSSLHPIFSADCHEQRV